MAAFSRNVSKQLIHKYLIISNLKLHHRSNYNKKILEASMWEFLNWNQLQVRVF